MTTQLVPNYPFFEPRRPGRQYTTQRFISVTTGYTSTFHRTFPTAFGGRAPSIDHFRGESDRRLARLMEGYPSLSSEILVTCAGVGTMSPPPCSCSTAARTLRTPCPCCSWNLAIRTQVMADHTMTRSWSESSDHASSCNSSRRSCAASGGRPSGCAIRFLLSVIALISSPVIPNADVRTACGAAVDRNARVAFFSKTL